jgi:hypothetical protein
MSMNLRSDALPLRQTNTWESNLIFSANEYGDPDGGWEGVARRYLFWAKMRYQAQFNACSSSFEKQEEIAAAWGDHIREIETKVMETKASGGSIHFWIQ